MVNGHEGLGHRLSSLTRSHEIHQLPGSGHGDPVAGDNWPAPILQVTGQGLHDEKSDTLEVRRPSLWRRQCRSLVLGASLRPPYPDAEVTMGSQVLFHLIVELGDHPRGDQPAFDS